MHALKDFTSETQQIDFVQSIANSVESGAHLSFYLPTSPADTSSTIKVKFAALFAEADSILARTMKKSEIDLLLEPINHVANKFTSKTGIKGIAVFRSQQALYHTFLYEPPPELAVIASSFHIKPLIHCLSSRVDCIALTITPRQIKAYHVDGFETKLLQTYDNQSEAVERKTKIKPGFVGQKRRKKEDTDKFVREVTLQLIKDLNLRRHQLAVFGPRYLRKRLFLEVSARSKVEIFHDSSLCSSMSEMTKKLEAAFRSQKRERSQRLAKRTIGSQNKSLMSTSLQEIATAAVEGRIDRLMIDPTVQVWGLFDRESGLVSTHTHQISEVDDCIVDDITEEVMKKGGDVTFFDSTRLGNVAPYIATLRW